MWLTIFYLKQKIKEFLNKIVYLQLAFLYFHLQFFSMFCENISEIKNTLTTHWSLVAIVKDRRSQVIKNLRVNWGRVFFFVWEKISTSIFKYQFPSFSNLFIRSSRKNCCIFISVANWFFSVIQSDLLIAWNFCSIIDIETEDLESILREEIETSETRYGFTRSTDEIRVHPLHNKKSKGRQKGLLLYHDLV